MDITQFSEQSPGRLERISEKDHSFIPDDLPPKWSFPLELWPLLAETKQQIGILEGVGRNLPNPAILLRPLGDREAIRSSRLEGTYATPKELLLFELERHEAKSESDAFNAQREVFNYRRALDHGTTSQLPLSQRLIRELHEILLRGVRGKDRAPGDFRRIQVAIGPNYRFVPPPIFHLSKCLDALERYMNIETALFDPIVDCFFVHYQFETIHPFHDGNGRVGRLILAIMFQRKCGLTKPWLYMSEFYERNREEYIQRLFNVSAKGDWTSWIEFCLRGVCMQARDALRRCERLLEVRAEFTQRVNDAGGSVRLRQIVDDIFHSPFVRIADLPTKLGVTYPTAQTDVARLVQANILKEVPNVRPKTFYAPEVYNIAYDEMETT